MTKEEGRAISVLLLVILISVGVIAVLAIASLILGIRVVRPTTRGLVERLGKYNRYADPGLHVIIPILERMYKVDVQVYLKVKADEENVKASQYNVTNYEYQVVNLARTTLRNIIGTLSLK